MPRPPADPLQRSVVAVLIATALAVACLPKEEDNTDSSGDSAWGYTGYSYGYDDYSYGYSTGDDDVFGPEDVVLSATSAGLSLTLSNNSTAFDFGVIESGSCGSDCWQAEGCIEETAGYAFCHDAGTTGVFLANVTTPDEVVSSSTTLFSDAHIDSLTYMLDDGADCYTWGSTPGYYIDVGCSAW